MTKAEKKMHNLLGMLKTTDEKDYSKEKLTNEEENELKKLRDKLGILDNKVENAIGGRSYGVGIRIFKGLKSVYAYTNDNSLSSLLDTAYKAAIALGELKEEKEIFKTKIKIRGDK